MCHSFFAWWWWTLVLSPLWSCYEFVAINILVHVCVFWDPQERVSPGCGIAGHRVCLCSLLTDDMKQFSKAMHQFVRPPAVRHSSSCSASLPAFGVLGLSNSSHSGFNGVFPTKPFFTCWLAVGYPLLWSACSSHLSDLNKLSVFYFEEKFCPDPCGWTVWVLACTLKGGGFDPRPPSGSMWEATQSMCLSHMDWSLSSLSLPLPPSFLPLLSLISTL